jgi:hypothetical protein
MLVTCLAYSSTLKMETVHEISVNFYWATLCHIPEDGTLHSHHHDNLRSNQGVLCLEVVWQAVLCSREVLARNMNVYVIHQDGCFSKMDYGAENR